MAFQCAKSTVVTPFNKRQEILQRKPLAYLPGELQCGDTATMRLLRPYCLQYPNTLSV